MEAVSGVRAILFDTFGSVVDWRTSLISELSLWGKERGVSADWTGLVDDWREAYAPSLDRVRRGELPWTILDDLHRMSLETLLARYGVLDLSEADKVWINDGWRRLNPWPDAIPGLTRLKQRYIIAPLSNGNFSLLLAMAKAKHIPWDTILGGDLFRHYKPDPETYLGAATLLGFPPDQIMMAASHNYDLRAARSLGFRTAFWPRPTEYGPRQKRDLSPEEPWDVVATDIEDLATQMGC